MRLLSRWAKYAASQTRALTHTRTGCVYCQNLNPRFDDTFAFKMPSHLSCSVDMLEVEVFDWNSVTKDVTLGKTKLDLCSEVFSNGWHTTVREQYPLTYASGPSKPDDRGGPGEVGLRLHFVPDLPIPPE